MNSIRTDNRSFLIQVENEITLNQILELNDSKAPIQRSSHIGNQYISNLVLTSLGIPINQFDRSVPIKDKNYHPDLRIQNGQTTRILDIGEVHKLTRNLKTHHCQSLFEYFNKGSVEIYPSSNVFQYSQYIQDNSDLILEIFQSLSFDLTQWNRFVLEDGTIQNRTPANKNELLSQLLDVTSFNGGYIFPNIINTLVVGIVDLINSNDLNQSSKLGTVYHISGRDMIQYLPNQGNVDLLSQMYSQVLSNSQQLSDQLPPILEFKLVPSFQLNLAVPKSFQIELDDLLALNLEKSQINSEKGKALANCSSTHKKEVIAHFDQLKKELEQKEKELFQDLSKFFFPDLAKASFYTQFDVLAEQNMELYIPQYLYNTPANSINNYLKQLSKHK
ncbi:MAG: hypothetical protein ACRCXZ_01260 [Patescibacteria group bacterium]